MICVSGARHCERLFKEREREREKGKEKKDGLPIYLFIKANVTRAKM